MSFIVIVGQVVGGNGTGFEVVWSSDMEEKRSMRDAIRHGFKTRGSDDFRIGQLSGTGQWLKSLSWMGKTFFDDDEIRDTADQLGLRNYWDDPDDGCGVGWGA
jgi:hypothetical protein